MEMKFRIDGVKPISLNTATKVSAVRGRPRKYKTKKTNIFECKVRSELKKYQDQFFEINQLNSIEPHYFVMEYYFYYPIMTKKGTISKTAGDVDNLIKPVQDIFFENLNFDDSQITSVFAQKTQSEKPFIIVNIKAIPLHLLP